jgi:hypothetical protein
VTLNAARNSTTGVCTDDRSDEDGESDPGTDDNAQETEGESDRGPSGLHFWKELGEGFERDLAMIGMLSHPLPVLLLKNVSQLTI